MCLPTFPSCSLCLSALVTPSSQQTILFDSKQADADIILSFETEHGPVMPQSTLKYDALGSLEYPSDDASASLQVS